jgi:hypothetical protein
VDIGPGRGEAPVFEGDGIFRSLPYATLDLTNHFTPPPSSSSLLESESPVVVVAIEAMKEGGPAV